VPAVRGGGADVRGTGRNGGSDVPGPHPSRSQFANFWFRLWDIQRLVGVSSEGPRRKPIAVADLPSPAWRPPEDTAVGQPDRIGELVFSVPGSTEPKGEVGNLLKLGVESGMGKGDRYVDLWKEALGRAQRGPSSP
jgi:hypothetical protein